MGDKSYIYKSFDFKGDGQDVLKVFCAEPHMFFLDSSQHDPHRGRYSLIGFDPFENNAAYQVARNTLMNGLCPGFVASRCPAFATIQVSAAGLLAKLYKALNDRMTGVSGTYNEFLAMKKNFNNIYYYLPFYNYFDYVFCFL